MKTEGYIANHLYCTGTGHCPSTGHSYIKATYHEWNNSKEERFPPWLPWTPLCVWMHCCDHLKSFTQKKIIHYKDRYSGLHCYGTSIQGTQNHACAVRYYTPSNSIHEDISHLEVWRAQKERGCFSLGNLLSAQFITQTEARPLLLCPPYLKKAYSLYTIFALIYLSPVGRIHSEEWA